MDSNAIFAILLLIVGLAILAAEIFVPSGGPLGVITFFSLVVSLIFAYRAWGTSHPHIFAVFCLMLLLLVPTVVGTGFYMLPRTALGKKVLLEAPELQNLTPYAAEARRLKSLVGKYGTALSMLNPGGLVNVDGERMHAFTNGLSVDPGQTVEVIDVSGTRLVVQPASKPHPDSTANERSADLPSKFDFDFPST